MFVISLLFKEFSHYIIVSIKQDLHEESIEESKQIISKAYTYAFIFNGKPKWSKFDCLITILECLCTKYQLKNM